MTGSGNVEQDWINMLMASPLFQQINDLQEMLDKSTGGATPDVVIGEQCCLSIPVYRFKLRLLTLTVTLNAYSKQCDDSMCRLMDVMMRHVMLQR